jgi:hypothetical protein
MNADASSSGTSTSPLQPALRTLFVRVAEFMKASGEFSDVRCSESIEAAAPQAAAPATYSVRFDPHSARIWVALEMADRWLSESIESQLVEFGDSMEELLEDELIECGYPEAGGTPITKVEHFRSEDRLFTFRACVGTLDEPLDSPRNVLIVSRAIAAFEACFRQLGDMCGNEDGATGA